MSETKHIPLRIDPAPNGGFMVSEGGSDPGRYYGGPLLACTTLGEALEFIRGRLAPVEAKAAAPTLCTTCDKPGYLPCDNCPKVALLR